MSLHIFAATLAFLPFFRVLGGLAHHKVRMSVWLRCVLFTGAVIGCLILVEERELEESPTLPQNPPPLVHVQGHGLGAQVMEAAVGEIKVEDGRHV